MSWGLDSNGDIASSQHGSAETENASGISHSNSRGLSGASQSDGGGGGVRNLELKLKLWQVLGPDTTHLFTYV